MSERREEEEDILLLSDKEIRLCVSVDRSSDQINRLKWWPF